MSIINDKHFLSTIYKMFEEETAATYKKAQAATVTPQLINKLFDNLLSDYSLEDRFTNEQGNFPEQTVSFDKLKSLTSLIQFLNNEKIKYNGEQIVLSRSDLAGSPAPLGYVNYFNNYAVNPKALFDYLVFLKSKVAQPSFKNQIAALYQEAISFEKFKGTTAAEDDETVASFTDPLIDFNKFTSAHSNINLLTKDLQSLSSIDSWVKRNNIHFIKADINKDFKKLNIFYGIKDLSSWGEDYLKRNLLLCYLYDHRNEQSVSRALPRIVNLMSEANLTIPKETQVQTYEQNLQAPAAPASPATTATTPSPAETTAPGQATSTAPTSQQIDRSKFIKSSIEGFKLAKYDIIYLDEIQEFLIKCNQTERNPDVTKCLSYLDDVMDVIRTSSRTNYLTELDASRINKILNEIFPSVIQSGVLVFDRSKQDKLIKFLNDFMSMLQHLHAILPRFGSLSDSNENYVESTNRFIYGIYNRIEDAKLSAERNFNKTEAELRR